MQLPTLHMASLEDRRSSSADGQLGSVSPRPMRRLGKGSVDDSLDVEQPAAGRRGSRSPSQPMLSLLEHSEMRTHRRSAEKPLATSQRPDSMRARCRGVFYEGQPQWTTNGASETLFRSNPTKSISSVAVSELGSHVAVGDRMGRVWIAGRHDTKDSTPSGSHDDTDSFQFWVGKRCYAPVIDPLNSVEVPAAVNRMAFLPQLGNSLHLLTTNEKVPKLYKTMDVRQTPKAPNAVSSIGSKVIGPLTSPQRIDTVAMKQVHHYAMDHEYSIHTVCATSDASTFYTADDLCVRQWCVDYPQSSIEVYAMKKPSAEGGDVKELLRSAAVFPWEPSLCFMATTAGCVRVVDTRESMRWSDREALSFSVRPREVSDGPFMELTNAFSSCSLSPCGRYLCAKDFMSVPVWDIRRSGDASSLIRRVELHPELRPRFDVLYHSDLLMERYDVHFLSSEVVVTGSFDNVLCMVNVNQLDSDVESAIPQPHDAISGVTKYRLPSGPLSEGSGTALEPRPSNYFALEQHEGTDALGRVTALTTPQLNNGRVELCAAYGEYLAHVSFPAVA
jgi:serine/threonine-protein phosphatase 2A regulatory subunit B